MKIYNDHKAIEQMIVVFNREIEQLKSLRDQLATQVDTLYQSGFKDRKFLELKNVMDGSGQTILQFNSAINSLVEELSKRRTLIMEYYSIAL